MTELFRCNTSVYLDKDTTKIEYYTEKQMNEERPACYRLAKMMQRQSSMAGKPFDICCKIPPK